MSKTDSGDAVGTDKEKQANNLKDSSIKGINQKISGKDPKSQELPFQKNVSSEVGLKDSNNIATKTKLLGNVDQQRLANLRTKGSNVDSRSVGSSNSAEKRKRETGKTVESISLSGINHSRESSSRKLPSRDGISLIPGRVSGKLAESASSNKAPETVVSGSGSSLMRADDPDSTVVPMARRSRRITDTPKMANYAKNVPDSGGLSGVNSEIKARLAEIGLKHVPVAPQGNCFFLAASFGLFKKTSKFLEVRRAGAKYVEENIEQLKEQVADGECEETMTSLRAMGAHVDELGINAVSLAYGRPIEISYEARLLAPGASNYCLWRLRTWTMRGGAAVAAKACIGEFRWSLHPGPTQVNKVNGKLGNGLGTCRTGDYFGRKGHFLSRWVVGWYERRLIGGDKGDGSVGSVDALKCQRNRGLMRNYYMDGWVGQPSPPPWVVLSGGCSFFGEQPWGAWIVRGERATPNLFPSHREPIGGWGLHWWCDWFFFVGEQPWGAWVVRGERATPYLNPSHWEPGDGWDPHWWAAVLAVRRRTKTEGGNRTRMELRYGIARKPPTTEGRYLLASTTPRALEEVRVTKVMEAIPPKRNNTLNNNLINYDQ
jgi:hypothetical protein